jgi:HD-like signal output (HDOD) protein
LIAKDVAKIMGLEEGEEAFICAMLYNLGKQIVLFYLPKEYADITKLVLKNATTESEASKSVLGISFEELGIAVAEKWNLPDKIVTSMKRLSRMELQGRNGKNNNALQGLSNFSNELCYIINDTDENKREASFSALLQNYKKHIPLLSFYRLHMKKPALGPFMPIGKNRAPPSGRTIQVPEHASQPVVAGHQASRITPPDLA